MGGWDWDQNSDSLTPVHIPSTSRDVTPRAQGHCEAYMKLWSQGFRRQQSDGLQNQVCNQVHMSGTHVLHSHVAGLGMVSVLRH